VGLTCNFLDGAYKYWTPKFETVVGISHQSTVLKTEATWQ